MLQIASSASIRESKANCVAYTDGKDAKIANATQNPKRSPSYLCKLLSNDKLVFFVQLSLVFSKAAAWYPRHLPCFSYLNVVKRCVSLALEGLRKMSSKLDKLLKDVQKMVILNYIAGFLLKRKTVLISKKKIKFLEPAVIYFILNDYIYIVSHGVT